MELMQLEMLVAVDHRGLPQGERVASHMRARKPCTAATNPEHCPASHRAHLDWPPSLMIQWACTVGPRTAEMVEKMLQVFPHPEMGCRSCLGIIRLALRWVALENEQTVWAVMNEESR